jgi:subtilisin family serine protease
VYSVKKEEYDSKQNAFTNDIFGYKQYWLEEMNIEKAQKSIKKGRTVTIAIVDDGININHPDLTDNIWVNNFEIPGNGIDDDRNGYVDDYN